VLSVFELVVWGMSDKWDAVKIDDTAWASMVRMSAAILTRDFGSRSHQEALRLSTEYKYEKNERARLFWMDVAASIERKNFKFIQ
jgi:hypothetical protein